MTDFKQVASWDVVPKATAPTTVSKIQNVNVPALCAGATVGVTNPTGGAPGIGCIIQYQFLRGAAVVRDWSSDSSYVTTVADIGNTIHVKARRVQCAASCDAANESGNLQSWEIIARPTIPLMEADPAVSSVCPSAELSVNLLSEGTGGVGTCSVRYQASVDGGMTWEPSGWAWSTVAPDIIAQGDNNRVRARRVCGSPFIGCISDTIVVQWNVVDQPDIAIQPPSEPDVVCFQGNSMEFGLSAIGGTPSLAYQWQYAQGGLWSNVAEDTPAGAVYANGDKADGFQVAGITVPGDHKYRCVVSASGPGCMDATSMEAHVRVRRALFPQFSFSGNPIEGQEMNVTVEDELTDGVKGLILLKDNIGLVLADKEMEAKEDKFLLPEGTHGESRRICVELYFEDSPDCRVEYCSNAFRVLSATLQELAITLSKRINCSMDTVHVDATIKLRQDVNCQDTMSNDYPYMLMWNLVNASNEIIVGPDSVELSRADEGPFTIPLFSTSGLSPGRYKASVSLKQECEKVYAISGTMEFVILPADVDPEFSIFAGSQLDLSANDSVLCPGVEYKIFGSFKDSIFGEYIQHSLFEFSVGGLTAKDSLVLLANASNSFTAVPVSFTVTGGCVYRDTIQLVTRPAYDLVAADEAGLCSGDTLVRTVDPAFDPVVWSLGGDTLSVAGALAYPPPLRDSTYTERIRVQADRAGCRYLDSLELQVIRVRGEILPWPDTLCPTGFYQVMTSPGVAVSALDIPEGWSIDTLSDFLFRPLGTDSLPLTVHLMATSAQGCRDTLLFRPDTLFVPAAPGALFYDRCARTLLAPPACTAGRGAWYRVDRAEGQVLTLPDTANFAREIDPAGLASSAYVFLCADCGPVAVLRAGADSLAVPCDPAMKFTLHGYPNPARESLNLALDHPEAGTLRLEVTSLAGHPVHLRPLHHPGGQALYLLDTSGWVSGWYLLTLTDAEGRRRQQPFLIIP